MKISARNALIGVVATAAVTLSAGTAQATHANSCTVNYSGVDARRIDVLDAPVRAVRVGDVVERRRRADRGLGGPPARCLRGGPLRRAALLNGPERKDEAERVEAERFKPVHDAVELVPLG